ncbi:MAG TPA: hypothetical protein VLN45_06555, partial [Ignavibacteriaceae bacterium]|nr:hypothetical protein [Ignavibacteriaceae bacterium]
SRSDIGMFGGPGGEKYTYHDLAPKPPANITAVYQNNSILLNWERNTEADLSHYRIYRDTVPNFIYDISKMVGETADTTFSDILPDPNTSKNYYYKITAFDNQQNQSASSEEVHVIVTGLGEIPPQVVEEYKLLNNYPNPFNPSTTIAYRLKEAGYVKLMVYNILGELVRVMINQWQDKGYYEVMFTPNAEEKVKGKIGSKGLEFETGYYGDIVSGIYLYRIEVIGEGNIPRFSDMKKMMLVK